MLLTEALFVGKAKTIIHKWIDKETYTWEFFKDGSYVKSTSQNVNIKKGTYKLNFDLIFIDRDIYSVKYLTNDSIYIKGDSHATFAGFYTFILDLKKQK